LEPGHPDLSLVRQCQLLDVNRASYYYTPVGESAYNQQLMRLIDEQYTKTPFYGSPRMTAWLQRQGYRVNHKRVERLMEVMGLQALYPKPNLSKPTLGHRVYPYLLRDTKIVRVDQVWSCDITYIRMAQGFVYLMAVMDWFSRYLLSWSVSISLDTDFCLEALETALRRGKPAIFNTDQGSQFTSDAFTGRLLQADIAISMDGRGRALDNIFIERLWRTLKYEEVYLKSYQSVPQARESLKAYLHFYNEERLHQSLGYHTPAEIYTAARS
jgi:putative transposase